MNECVHEREVLDLVLADRWPDRCDPDMVTHASTCDVCADVVAVALAMREDEARVEAEVVAAQPHHQSVVPDATLVWWRAQIRAREDAARKAARPIAMVQGIAIGIGLVALLSTTRMAWPWIKTYAGNTATGIGDVLARSLANSGAAIEAAPLWITLSVVGALIAAPLAIYAAIRD